MIQQRFRLTIGVLVLLGLSAGFARAEDQPDRLLEQMKRLSVQTVVQILTADGKQPAALIPAPIFRYDDQPRRILDATLWAWIHDGRLVAFQKVELNDQLNAPRWTFCFASFSPHNLDVKWPNGKTFQTVSPGVVMDDFPDAPRPAAKSFLRTQQMKNLAQRFSATITNTPDGTNVAEMRLLPKPVFLFPAKPATPTLGIYGLNANSTNPDAYLVFQVESDGDAEKWTYGARRMTSGGVRVRLDDEPVWETKWIRSDPDPKEAWTFFNVPLDEIPSGKDFPEAEK